MKPEIGVERFCEGGDSRRKWNEKGHSRYGRGIGKVAPDGSPRALDVRTTSILGLCDLGCRGLLVPSNNK